MALYGFDNYVVIHKKHAFKYSLNVNLILLLTSHPKEIKQTQSEAKWCDRAMWLCGQYNSTLPTIIQLSKYLGTNGSYFLDFVRINVAPNCFVPVEIYHTKLKMQ